LRKRRAKLMGGMRIDLEARSSIVKELRKGGRPSVVAKKFGVSRSSVIHIGREAGIVQEALSDRQKRGQRIAVEAARAEARRRRSALSLQLITDVERLRLQMFAPAIVVEFAAGGEHFGFHEHKLKEPDARAKRDLAIALAILVDKHVAIERLENEANTGTVKGAIVSLIDRLEADELATKVVVAT
jgi:hypothetical protein